MSKPSCSREHRGELFPGYPFFAMFPLVASIVLAVLVVLILAFAAQ
jgi:hypothetical protein